MRQPSKIHTLLFTFYPGLDFWKSESQSNLKRLSYRIYNILSHPLTITIYAILESLDTYMRWNDFEELTDSLCSTLPTVVTAIRIWMLYFTRKQAKELLIKLDNNFDLMNMEYNEGDQKILDKSSKELTNITIMYYSNSVLCLSVWFNLPLLATKRKFPTAFPMWEGVTESPKYEIIYFYCVIMGLTIVNNVMSCDLIIYGFLLRIRAHLEILAERYKDIKKLYPQNDVESDDRGDFLQELNNEVDAKKRHKEAKKIMKANIIYHQAVLKASKEINNVFHQPIAAVIAVGLGIMGVAFFLILSASSFDWDLLRKMTYVACALFDLFLHCYYGTTVKEQSDRLRETIYDTPWYEMEKELKPYILIPISELQKPPKIKAGKVISMTLESYLDFLKISYDMIAILRQANSRSG